MSEVQSAELPREHAEVFAAAKSLYHKDEVDQAGAILSDLLETMVEQFGQLGGPCARVYQLYGLCLIASARKEAPMMAAEDLMRLADPSAQAAAPSAAPAASAASASSTSKGAASASASSKPSTASTTEKKAEQSPRDGNDDDDDDDGQLDDDDEGDGDEKAGDNQQEGQAAEGDGEQEDDASLVQVGWECLECARVIYSRLPDSEETRTRQADVHFELGSVYLETDQYREAEEELEQCVALRRKWRPSTRDLAQALFQLGIAHRQLKQSQKAIAAFSEAVDILDALIREVDGKSDKRSQRSLRDLKAVRAEVAAHRMQAMQQAVAPTASSSGNVASMTDTFDAPTVTSPTTHIAAVKPRKKTKAKNKAKATADTKAKVVPSKGDDGQADAKKAKMSKE
ncbi:hypothetical protein PTSG_07956 [Salpingoeca rosetta]|uniref:Uncharacterized protein n=1 Tax=Salpingoeca rosetta (strain ATCC 50818 / BSB-021) TaxID=946362 RepID=F2UGT8_SALR5|nr:uncharacterized protein PTSG_07956 [Salpingoeca rosetta]EGD75838.1 hypothetical protein PTSG_07956 [Salpingoeca rosetta]|eukprot:XP_004991759.1 hypothetical protein PTSG_07956 [Salpingoeca rosetta]